MFVSKNDIEELKTYVIEELVEMYGYKPIQAKKVMNHSSFNKVLNERPSYIFHYNIEHWAEDIYNEDSKKDLFMCV